MIFTVEVMIFIVRVLFVCPFVYPTFFSGKKFDNSCP